MDNGTGGGFDATLLEGLPLNQFNWGEWNVSLPPSLDPNHPFSQRSRRVRERRAQGVEGMDIERRADEQTYFEGLNNIPLNQGENLGNPNSNSNSNPNINNGGQGFGQL